MKLVKPAAPPVLRPADDIRAAGLFPASAHLQSGWLAAVAWLRRDPSASRWILDHQIGRKA